MIYPGFSNVPKNDSESSVTVVADSSTTRAQNWGAIPMGAPLVHAKLILQQNNTQKSGIFAVSESRTWPKLPGQNL
jgi:hypothetical protein